MLGPGGHRARSPCDRLCRQMGVQQKLHMHQTLGMHLKLRQKEHQDLCQNLRQNLRQKLRCRLRAPPSLLPGASAAATK